MARSRPKGHPRGCDCAPCEEQRTYQREWARRNATPERRARRAALYRKNLDRSRAESRARASADLARRGDEIRARRRARYAANRLTEAARAAAWRKANPAAAAETIARARAKRGPVPDLQKPERTRRRRERVGPSLPVPLPLWADGMECYLCGTPMFDPTPHAQLRRSIDHIRPITLGGKHEEGNLAWVHRYCNAKKHAKEITPGNVPEWFRQHLQQRIAQKGGTNACGT